MSFLKWNEELSVGIPSIDEEHKALVQHFNALHEAVHLGAGEMALKSVIDGMITYIVSHFGHEEAFMRATDYPGFKQHKEEHLRIWRHVMTIDEKAKGGVTDDLANEVLAFLKDWIMGHVLYDDRAMGEHLKASGLA